MPAALALPGSEGGAPTAKELMLSSYLHTDMEADEFNERFWRLLLNWLNTFNCPNQPNLRPLSVALSTPSNKCPVRPNVPNINGRASLLGSRDTATCRVEDVAHQGLIAQLLPFEAGPQGAEPTRLGDTVSFSNPRVLECVLPSDAQRLSESLSVVAGKEGILPAALRHHADFAGSRVRPFMWAPAGVGVTPDEYQTVLKNHEQLQDITYESTTSFALSRSEAAWNCRVHGPFLKFALRQADGIDFEPITSAQIISSFRPMFKSNDGAASAASTASSASSVSAASGHDSTPSQNRPSAPASFAHKMVDFALVLKPDESLQTLISDFLHGEKYETASINQTRYEPLRKQPAPIFIETKTLSETVESARVQLGIWIAAWHERMRSIITLGGNVKPVITVPAIQVLDSLWTLFFVVDGGTEILQAAMSVLAGWAKETFEPWLVEVLTGAIANRL
ncbi:hypothetical protein MY11210_008297 [Beauveria gryllotalpidicola]